MAGDPVLAALGQETRALIAALSALPAPAWDRPTRCSPWLVRDVVGHVVVVLARVNDMLSAPAPDGPEVTATEYYRADERFSARANADRIRTARERADVPDRTELVRDLAETWRAVDAHCRRQPAGRIVQTRHADAMALPDFLSTRVVEVAVHGLDVADAVSEPPWLTPAAAEHLQQVLFGPGAQPDLLMLRKATGRAPLEADEAAALERLGMRRLTLG